MKALQERSNESGAVLLEAALAFSCLATLIVMLIAIILQLRVESMTYEALRQSSAELMRWTPPEGVRTPDGISAIQCETLRSTVKERLKKLGMEPDDFRLGFRRYDATDGSRPGMQEMSIVLPTQNAILSPVLGPRRITIRYLPKSGVPFATCQHYNHRGGPFDDEW